VPIFAVSATPIYRRFFADILPIYRQLTLTNISASFADISAKIEKRRDFYAGFHITA
jgi:hypothetical protein